PQLPDQLTTGFVGAPGIPMRPRAAVDKTVAPCYGEAPTPLAHSPAAHGEVGRVLLGRAGLASQNQFESTFRSRPCITVQVHPGFLLRDLLGLATQDSLGKPRVDNPRPGTTYLDFTTSRPNTGVKLRSSIVRHASGSSL